jgi:spore photoproduct lyase
VLLGWYPGTSLEMDEAKRARKTTKFGSTKLVYPAATMRELRDYLEDTCAARLPEGASSTGREFGMAVRPR